MARNPSADQPRTPGGQYATRGKPSKRDRSWRTEAGYEDTSEAEDTEPDTPSDAKAARQRPSPPLPKPRPKRVRRPDIGASESGQRLSALRDRGYKGPVDQDGYATTEAEFMAKYERDKAAAKIKAMGPGHRDRPDEPTYDEQRLTEAEAAYQKEKARGDKLRAKWGQGTASQSPASGRPRHLSRFASRGKAKASEVVPEHARAANDALGRAADRAPMRLVRAGARRLASTIDNDRPLG